VRYLTSDPRGKAIWIGELVINTIVSKEDSRTESSMERV